MTRTEIESLLHALDLLDGGDLDGAHRIVQALEGYPAADVVHAIVHRREGDFPNSVYWWRRAGDEVPRALRELYGDHAAFVDQCRRTIPGSKEAAVIASVERQEVQMLRTLLAESQAA